MDFAILNNLSFHKEYHKLDSVQLRNYSPFLINRGFSQFPDSVLQANAMNQRSYLPKQTQFDYLFHAVRKRKRFSKWPKKQNIDIIPYIVDYFSCSPREAEEYAKLISEEVKTEIRSIYGGTTKSK